MINNTKMYIIYIYIYVNHIRNAGDDRGPPRAASRHDDRDRVRHRAPQAGLCPLPHVNIPYMILLHYI